MRQQSVLIVNEDEHLLEALEAAFTGAGYLVATATNGLEALTVARALIPDMIICNFALPGINGSDLFEKLQQTELTSSIRLVFSVSCQSEERFLKSELGIADDQIIYDPFTLVGTLPSPVLVA